MYRPPRSYQTEGTTVTAVSLMEREGQGELVQREVLKFLESLAMEPPLVPDRGHHRHRGQSDGEGGAGGAGAERGAQVSGVSGYGAVQQGIAWDC
ncbi:UNVERIFIED_CONTAM: hypothetical protein FKN15_025612 [Acipenser sinensis]